MVLYTTHNILKVKLGQSKTLFRVHFHMSIQDNKTSQDASQTNIVSYITKIQRSYLSVYLYIRYKIFLTYNNLLYLQRNQGQIFGNNGKYFKENK